MRYENKKNILIQCYVIMLMLARVFLPIGALWLCGGQVLWAKDKRIALEAKIKKIAEGKGVGYKCANLIELEGLGEKFNEEEHAYKIAVPPYVCISSDKIQDFLQTLNFDIAAKWGSIVTKHFVDNSKAQEEALKSHAFSDAFLKACASFRTELRTAFSEFINSSINESMNLDELFGKPGINKLLARVLKDKESLTVRSTGKEDTPELANAGGNESISNVQPNPRDVLEALSDVVVSYFGEKSLKQRLGAKDLSIFVPQVFIPVIIQRMIAESTVAQAKPGQPEGVLPKCGVMFTEEPEGGISRYHDIADKDGQIKTTGICMIQAAYGHNEAVVNSLIPVDTFYVDANQSIYPVIRPKTHRMKPIEGPTIIVGDKEKKRLTLVPNDPVIATKSSLSKEAVITLKAFAVALENHYLRPMDIEFVINEQEKTIYIVQARPIVHKSGLPPASYLVNPEAIPDKQKLSGSAIGVAGGSLRWATGSDQIVADSTINEALNKYQDKKVVPDSSKIQSIIIGKMAAATSHEATTFRSEGKPVIYLESWGTVTQWLKQPSPKLLISPQQDLVVNWSGEQKTLDDILNNKQIAALGWVSYPIPPFMSLSKEFLDSKLSTDAIENLLPQSLDQERYDQLRKLPLSTLLQKVKRAEADESAVALRLILLKVVGAIKQRLQDVSLSSAQVKTILLLQQYVLRIAQSIKTNLAYKPTDLEYTKRLLPIRFLEALLYQQPAFGQIVDGWSVTTLIFKELAQEQKITRDLQAQGIALDKRSLGYLRMQQIAMTPELEHNWNDFVLGLYKVTNDSLKNNFFQMIVNLGKLNMWPVWMHTSFAHTYEKTKHDSEQTAQQLIKEYNSQNNFLEMLQEKKQELSAFGIAAFADPKNFDTAWDTFQTNILKYFLSDDFATVFNQANNLGKLAAVSIMTTLVNDVFDLSIKAVTGSQLYEVRQKVQKFHMMLKKYNELFKKWITLVPEGAINYGYHSSMSASSYLKIVDSILSEERPAANLLKLTPGFDASAFIIGSGMGIIGSHIVKPETFEDVFTIVHQSLLVILNVLGSNAGIEIQLPPFLQMVVTEFQEKIVILDGNKNKKPTLISIDLFKDSITLFYNMPLRES